MDGIIHDSFRDACIALNLCNSDKQWDACMHEAVEILHSRTIRDLFCNILLHCNPTKPEDLYEKYKEDMSDDFRLKRSDDIAITDEIREQLVINDLLDYLCKKLKECDKINSDFNIPMPDMSLIRETLNTSMEVDPEAEDFYNRNVNMLNEEQRQLFDTIMNALNKDEGGLFDLDAPGGCGKTFLANIILPGIRKVGELPLLLP